MIRFSALLVAVAVGLLVAGVVTSKLSLVYVAIGVSGVALLALAVGALVKRKELFGPSASAEPQLARPEPAAAHVSPGPPAPQAVPWEAAVPAASAWPAAAAQPAPSRAGYLPAEQPLPPQPVKAQPADAAATAWMSGIPTQTERPAERPAEHPAERPADVPRRPAAFTPRPPAGPPSPAPGVPAPGPSAWEWRPDAPATQEMPRIGAVPASASSAPAAPPAPPPPSVPPASATPPPPAAPPEWPAPAAAFVPQVASPPQDQPPQDQPPPAEDQHEVEDQPQDSPAAEETQQLPVAVSIATDAAPASSEGPEPAAEAAVTPEAPETPAAPKAPDTPDAPDTPEAPEAADLQREVTVVPGVPRYHHPHCLLIRFMGEDDLDKTTLGEARQAGCTPCRACLPDQAEADPELDPPEPERQAEIALDVLPPRISTRRSLDRKHLDREDLAGDQPRVFGQGRDHFRVL